MLNNICNFNLPLLGIIFKCWLCCEFSCQYEVWFRFFCDSASDTIDNIMNNICRQEAHFLTARISFIAIFKIKKVKLFFIINHFIIFQFTSFKIFFWQKLTSIDCLINYCNIAMHLYKVVDYSHHIALSIHFIYENIEMQMLKTVTPSYALK